MNVSSDSWGEMQHESDPTDSLVAELIGELRSWAAEPAPAPSPALLALLDGDAEPWTPPICAPRRKKKMIVAKLAGLGVAAKAALGVGVATAAVATAGVAGVLPAQTGQVTTDVTVTVPTSITTPDVSVPGTTPRVSIPGVTIPSLAALADDAGDDKGKPEDNHGACVSAVARDDTLSGRDHGRAVSAVAQSDCGKPATSSSTSSTSTPTTLSNAASPNRGPGNANGNRGSSNSGRGSSNSGSGSSNSGGRD